MNSPQIAALCDQAIALYQSGRLAEAEQVCVRICDADPQNFLGLYLKGVMQFLRGDPASAQTSIDAVMAAHPQAPQPLIYQGLLREAEGRDDLALASYSKALSLQPDMVEALAHRGTLLGRTGRPDQAITDFDLALTYRPDFVATLFGRATALMALKRPAEALAAFDRVLAQGPGAAGVWNNRGLVLRDLKRPEEALASFDKAIAAQPDYADAWNNRAIVLQDLNRLEEALAGYDRALSFQPGHAYAWNNRGLVLRGLKRADEALTSIDKALSLQPDYAEAWNSRGAILRDLNRLPDAAVSYAKALAISPDFDFLFGDYLHVEMKLCDWDRLDENLKTCAAGIAAGRKIIMPFYLLVMADDAAEQKSAARICADAKFPKSQALGPMVPRPAGDKIRIGYYSADFHNHATSVLMAQLLEAHDPKRFELYGFSFGPDRQDEMRRRVSAAFHEFVDVRTLTDRDIARLSRTRGIDIAVDLKGYTQDSRTGIFAEGAAPLQAAYLGYPGTMGADYIDYIIADGVMVPEGSEKYYSEKIIRLPHSYQANDSSRKISPRVFTRQEAGLPASGFVFCSFNSSYKILPETFASWMRILKAVDGSVLWLLQDNAPAAENLRKAATAHGVDAARLIFAGFLPLDEHLARHRLADLFLDTWPCNAHTTASDALWAGLPLVTRMGEAFASRVAASLLTAAGLPGLITTSTQDYEALAIKLATHPEKLAEYRKTLGEKRTTAPLFDGKLTARHLQAAYEAIYARYQSGLAPDNIAIPS